MRFDKTNLAKEKVYDAKKPIVFRILNLIIKLSQN